MCGVIGLVCEHYRADLGRMGAELLRSLEYRGYDSTGGAIQGHGESVKLMKGVGAPSALVHSLGIVDQPGQLFAGQVRWATFGAVTDANSQPHVVGCKINLYGAHNGNVTNCDALKAWLTGEGHRVLSDNDGEMVVHTIEHEFALEIGGFNATRDSDLRRAAMRRAIVKAVRRLEGSFAAVIIDPVSRCAWAIKAGSSLYFGIGRDDIGGRFTLASSDLSSVLKFTRVVVPIIEGEFIEFDGKSHQFYALRDHAIATPNGPAFARAGDAIERAPVRSRLRAKDTALLPGFGTFMEQEIFAQEETARSVIRLFLGGSEAAQVLRPYLDALGQATVARIRTGVEAVRDGYTDESIREAFHALVDGESFQQLLASVPDNVRQDGINAAPEQLADRLVSSESGLFTDLLAMTRAPGDVLAVRLCDVLLEHEEIREFHDAVAAIVAACQNAEKRGGRILVACCGSSYNAARAAAIFFNELARIDLVPLLPGEFRERVSHTLRDGDLIISVSQSGETKDLIDILNDVIASGKDIKRIALVNNVNSTLAEEKSDIVLPLRCGPEIAVAATKSFMNQMVVFYCLALRLGEQRVAHAEPELTHLKAWQADLALRRQKLPELPALIRTTFDNTKQAVEEAAQLLFLRPSLHLLAIRLTALAREGALKIREVVLNHAEGFEGSEFKHGPNTILGFNTILGPTQVHDLLRALGHVQSELLRQAAQKGLGDASAQRLIQAATDAVFAPSAPPFALAPAEQVIFDAYVKPAELIAGLRTDYPLLYLTGPDDRDVNLTVSQINTHKIRGAFTVMIAEESADLRLAVSKAPVDNPDYRWAYIVLPRTDDALMVAFSATVVLQRLALQMSLKKAAWLNRLGVKDHGVHPDVPKNVSKSITVD